jgi:hypothetical protein
MIHSAESLEFPHEIGLDVERGDRFAGYFDGHKVAGGASGDGVL